MFGDFFHHLVIEIFAFAFNEVLGLVFMPEHFSANYSHPKLQLF